jgi:pimeloyl-ACP methyl ester carboxylesterase
MASVPIGSALSIEWRGGRLAVSCEGNGDRSLLFIHGNSSCKEAFSDLIKQPELEKFSCVAFDLPGHGESSDALDPDGTYTIPGYASAAAHVIAELGLQRPVVLGWSLGGHVAIELAMAHAREAGVAGVMITGTPPVGPGPSLLEGGFTPFTFEQSTGDENANEEALLEYAAHVYGVPQEQYAAFCPALLRTAPRARSRMTEHWLQHDGPSHLDWAKEGELPLAIVHGDKDPFVDPDFLDRIATPRLWGGKVLHLASSGHAPFLDAPEAFAKHLSRFTTDVRD